MKTVGKTLAVVLTLLPACAIGLAHSGQLSAGKEEVKKVKTKAIPLESIYTTSEQKGLKAVDEALKQSSKPLEELFERSVTMGASNVFLVRGNDIASAVQATRQVFTGSPVDEPVPPDQRSEPDSFWVVAYFGVSGSGEAWLVRSVEVKGREVRITFKTGVSENNDDHPYFLWIPLQKLEPGTYTLELFDQDRQQATLVRRVLIRKKVILSIFHWNSSSLGGTHDDEE